METANLQQLFLEKAKKASLSRSYLLEGISENGIFSIADMDTGENLEMEIVELTHIRHIERLVEAFRTVFFVFLEEKEGQCFYPYRFPCYRDFFLVNQMEKASIGMIYRKVEGETLESWRKHAQKEKVFMDLLFSIGYSVLISLFILHQHNIYHRNICGTAIFYHSAEKEWRKRVLLKHFEGSCNTSMGACEGTFREDIGLLGKTLRDMGGDLPFFRILMDLPSSFSNTKDVLRYYEFHHSHLLPGELMDECWSFTEK